ncbi:MAG: hypothetical protein WDN28_33350 [Chthoniobacter sp.]
MNSRKILFDVLQGTGLDEGLATELSTLQPQPGGSWTNEVLNSGRVDEIKFATRTGGGPSKRRARPSRPTASSARP